jgi:hypothetical protein
LNKKYISKAKKEGIKIYKSFKKMVLNTQPDYASTTMEYSMESPYDIKKDSKSYAFYDFYFDKNKINRNYIEDLQNWCKENDIYTEEFGNGVYFSVSSFFNPLNLDKYEFSDVISLKASKAIIKSYQHFF